MDPRTNNFFEFLTHAVAKTTRLSIDLKKYECNFMASTSEIEQDAKKHVELSVAGIEQLLTAFYDRLKKIDSAIDHDEIIHILLNLNHLLEPIKIRPKYAFETLPVTYYEYDTYTDIYEREDAYTCTGYTDVWVRSVCHHHRIEGSSYVRYFTNETLKEVRLNQLSQGILNRLTLFNNPPVIVEPPISVADKKSQLLQYQNPSSMSLALSEPSFFELLASTMLIPGSALQIDNFNGLARLKSCGDFSSCLLNQIEQALTTLDQPEKIRVTIAYKIAATPRNGSFTLFGTKTQRKLEALISAAIKNRQGVAIRQSSPEPYQDGHNSLSYYLPTMFRLTAAKTPPIADAIAVEKFSPSAPILLQQKFALTLTL